MIYDNTISKDQGIEDSINQAFINYNDKLDANTISYLSGLISESESGEELQDQINQACIDFDIIQDSNEIKSIINTLFNLLKKKGCINFSLPNKPPKSHLVCEINPVSTKSLDDDNLTMEDYLQLTRSEDPRVRVAALRKFCPCKVKADRDELWARIIEMSTDPNPKVRYQVMHNLCDGSPLYKEESVISVLEIPSIGINIKVILITTMITITNIVVTGKYLFVVGLQTIPVKGPIDGYGDGNGRDRKKGR
eukprot:gene438-554_t